MISVDSKAQADIYIKDQKILEDSRGSQREGYHNLLRLKQFLTWFEF